MKLRELENITNSHFDVKILMSDSATPFTVSIIDELPECLADRECNCIAANSDMLEFVIDEKPDGYWEKFSKNIRERLDTNCEHMAIRFPEDGNKNLIDLHFHPSRKDITVYVTDDLIGKE